MNVSTGALIGVACGALGAGSVALAQTYGSPPPSDVMPPSINTLDGAIGTSTQYARADHQHPTSVQRFVTSTGADGTVVWTFRRPFADAKYSTWASPGSPGVVCSWSNKTTTTVTWTCKTGLLTTLVPAANAPVDLGAGAATQ